jgi:hypothetical protein
VSWVAQLADLIADIPAAQRKSANQQLPESQKFTFDDWVDCLLPEKKSAAPQRVRVERNDLQVPERRVLSGVPRSGSMGLISRNRPQSKQGLPLAISAASSRLLARMNQ